MNIQAPQLPNFHRLLVPLAITATAGALLIASAPMAALPTASWPAAIEAIFPRTKPLSPAHSLPFSYQDVLRYLAVSLGVSPTQYGNTAVFSEQPNGREEDAYRVLVTLENQHLAVTFSGYGDYGMTIAREFFEAPFFDREETLRLYSLLEEGKPSQTVRFRRFTVRFQLQEHRDDFHLTLQFTPPLL